MIKAHIYTFFSVIFAIVFIYVSMLSMNIVLKHRQDKFLTEKGITTVQNPVKAWQKYEDTEKQSANKEEVNNSEDVLSSGQIADAVISWNNRSSDVLHSPVQGQISMETAIDKSKEWLKTMGVASVNMTDESVNMTDEKYAASRAVSSDVKDADTFVYATLSSAATEKDNKKDKISEQAEPYYSFWTVQFEDEEMSAVLYINAVTGNVWGATVNEEYDSVTKEPSYDKVELFWNLAGMQVSASDWLNISEKDTRAIYESNKELVYAVMDCKRHNVTAAVSAYTGEKIYKEYVTTEYHLEAK